MAETGIHSIHGSTAMFSGNGHHQELIAAESVASRAKLFRLGGNGHHQERVAAGSVSSCGKLFRPSGNGHHQERVVTAGGTFDTLHFGHQHYLRTAFEHADRVVLYVCSDEYARAKKVYEVRPYHLRVRRLESFISNKLGINRDRYEIRQLKTIAQVKNDLLNEDIHIALVVPEYYALLRRINKERMDHGKKGILILVKERTRDHKNGDLSSTAIRSGLVKRHRHSPNGHMKIRIPAHTLK